MIVDSIKGMQSSIQISLIHYVLKKVAIKKAKIILGPCRPPGKGRGIIEQVGNVRKGHRRRCVIPSPFDIYWSFYLDPYHIAYLTKPKWPLLWPTPCPRPLPLLGIGAVVVVGLNKEEGEPCYEDE